MKFKYILFSVSLLSLTHIRSVAAGEIKFETIWGEDNGMRGPLEARHAEHNQRNSDNETNTAWWPWGLATIDYDKDGDMDLLAAFHHGPRNGLLFKNLSTTTSFYFQNATVETGLDGLLGGTDSNPGVWDFDADGDFDIAAVMNDSPQNAFINNGNRTFTVFPSFYPLHNVNSNPIRDVNGDGYVDVSFVHGTETQLFIFQPATKSFVKDAIPKPVSLPPNLPEAIRDEAEMIFAGYNKYDLNNDGILDVVLSRFGGYGDGDAIGRYLITQPDGSLQDKGDAMGLPRFGSPLWIGDADADNDLDIILTATEVEGIPGTPALGGLYLNNGQGEFSLVNGPMTARLGPRNAYFPRIWAMDYNNDTRVDFVLSNRRYGGTWLMENLGNGQFREALSTRGWDADPITQFDINNDGLMDMVVGGEAPRTGGPADWHDTVTVFINRTTQAGNYCKIIPKFIPQNPFAYNTLIEVFRAGEMDQPGKRPYISERAHYDGTPIHVGMGSATTFDVRATFPGRQPLLLRNVQIPSNRILEINGANTPIAPKINQAPLLFAGSNRTVVPLTNVALTATASDDDLPVGNQLTYEWSVIDGAPGVTFSNRNILRPTVQFPSNGRYILRLTVRDGELSSTDDVWIIAEPAASGNNTAPKIEMIREYKTVGLFPFQIGAIVRDDGRPVGMGLSYRWNQENGTGVTFSNPTSLQTTVQFPGQDIYYLRLAVSDGQFLSTEFARVVVGNASSTNVAPTVFAGFNQVIALETELMLRGQASDEGLPLGNTRTNLWTVVSGPADGTATFSDATDLNSTVQFTKYGTYILRLSVSDGSLTGKDEVEITVDDINAPDNQAPSASAGSDITVFLQNPFTLTGQANDDGLPAGSSLTTQWSVIAGQNGVIITDRNRLDSPVQFPGTGIYTLRLTVSDGERSDTDDIRITVVPFSSNTNQPPTVSAGPDQIVSFPSVVTLSGQASDDPLPANRVLTSLWVVASGAPGVTISNPTSLNTTVQFPREGIYFLRLTVGDGALSSHDDMKITVGDVSQQQNNTSSSVKLIQSVIKPSEGQAAEFEFQAEKSGHLIGRLFTRSGRPLETIIDQETTQGFITRVEWDGTLEGKRMASGVYHFSLFINDDLQETVKLIIVK